MKALTEAAWRKQYQAGELVFLQGDQARIMFIIKAGRVKLAKVGTDGGEVLVDIRKAGDFLGETFLSEDAEYPLTAECMEESLLCGFTKERFERLVTNNPNIGLQIIRNMSDRISWLTSRAGSTSATHLEERLHAVLTDLAHEHGTSTEQGPRHSVPTDPRGTRLPRRGAPGERDQGLESTERIGPGHPAGQASRPSLLRKPSAETAS